MYNSFAWCKVFLKPYLVSFCVFVFLFFLKKQKRKKNKKKGRDNNVHSGESNYSSLSNYFVSAKKRKREWNNGILKFVYLYIYIYIFKKSTLVEDYFMSQTKVFQGCETLPSSVQKKKKRLWSWTVRSDEVNRKPFTKTVLLTSKTDIYEKLNEPCKPQFNLMDLKTVDGCGSPRISWFRVFFFFFLGT